MANGGWCAVSMAGFAGHDLLEMAFPDYDEAMKKTFMALLSGVWMGLLFSLPLPAGQSDETGVIVGMIEKCKLGFSAFCKFTVVADNGERKEIYVNRGESTIISQKGKPVWGVAPRKGRRIEVKYRVTGGGRLEAVFMRYLPPAAVNQPAAPPVPTPPRADTVAAAGATPNGEPSAEPAPVPQPSAQLAEPPEGVFAGTVCKVNKTFYKPPHMRNAFVTIVLDSGEKVEVDSVRETAVCDASGNDLTKGGKRVGAWKLRVGQRIEVKFMLGGDGHRKALSIRCLE